MKHSHYSSHWDIWEDYCVYCGKSKDLAKKFGASCSCFRFDEPHGIKRTLCGSCRREIRKEVERSGFNSTYILNMLESRRSHGEVQWN
jgi:hypothetical protein